MPAQLLLELPGCAVAAPPLLDTGRPEHLPEQPVLADYDWMLAYARPNSQGHPPQPEKPAAASVPTGH
jgi:hypothetical protein